jgi:hypothetical protein
VAAEIDRDDSRTLPINEVGDDGGAVRQVGDRLDRGSEPPPGQPSQRAGLDIQDPDRALEKVGFSLERLDELESLEGDGGAVGRHHRVAAVEEGAREHTHAAPVCFNRPDHRPSAPETSRGGAFDSRRGEREQVAVSGPREGIADRGSRPAEQAPRVFA